MISNPNILVRFIGDSLGDRGRNDWFILKILSKLKAENVHMRTTMSNHDTLFLDAMKRHGRLAKKHALKVLEKGWKRRGHRQGNSFFEFQDLLEQGFVSKTEVASLIKNVYLPTLVLLDYSLDSTTGELSIMSHAPIDLQSIQELADQFEVQYEGPSVQGLMRTIDAINQEFDYALKERKTNLVLQAGTAAYKVMWMRELPHKNEPGLYASRGNQETRNIDNIIFIHGHDRGQADHKVSPRVVRLDNGIGKGNLKSNDETEVVFISDETIFHSVKPPIDLTQDRSHKAYLKGDTDLIDMSEVEVDVVEAAEGQVKRGIQDLGSDESHSSSRKRSKSFVGENKENQENQEQPITEDVKVDQATAEVSRAAEHPAPITVSRSIKEKLMRIKRPDSIGSLKKKLERMSDELVDKRLAHNDRLRAYNKLAHSAKLSKKPKEQKEGMYAKLEVKAEEISQSEAVIDALKTEMESLEERIEELKSKPASWRSYFGLR